MEVSSILDGESRKRRRAGRFRFEGVADAITFAIEELPSLHLDLGEARFGGGEIRCLYNRAEFSLARRIAT